MATIGCKHRLHFLFAILVAYSQAKIDKSCAICKFICNLSRTQTIRRGCATRNDMMETSRDQEIFRRLLEAAGVKTDAAFAAAIGISHQAVYSAKKKGVIPPSWIVEVARKFGASADWLLSGNGPVMMAERTEEPSRHAVMTRSSSGIESVITADAEIVMVPMVEAKLSAGFGSFETDTNAERKYAFRYDFLKRKGNMSRMVLMRVAGDSMHPTIEDGDVVLIDQSQNQPIPGKIYAVGVEDMVYLKVIDAMPGKLVLKSVNSDYEVLEVDTREDMESQVRIIGRAVWICREY